MAGPDTRELVRQVLTQMKGVKEDLGEVRTDVKENNAAIAELREWLARNGARFESWTKTHPEVCPALLPKANPGANSKAQTDAVKAAAAASPRWKDIALAALIGALVVCVIFMIILGANPQALIDALLKLGGG